MGSFHETYDDPPVLGERGGGVGRDGENSEESGLAVHKLSLDRQYKIHIGTTVAGNNLTVEF